MATESNGAKVIQIEPMIRIEFSKYGAFARRRWPSGRVEDMTVEDAMKEFDPNIVLYGPIAYLGGAGKP